MKIKDIIVSPIAPNSQNVIWIDTSDESLPALKVPVNGVFVNIVPPQESGD